MGSNEREAVLSRIRIYAARVEALSSPFDADKLYAFFEEEARRTRRDQNSVAAVERMIDERLDALGVELE
jgi:hypothetical protein